jgi:hypothetical protein
VHGGSLRVYARRREEQGSHTPDALAIANEEARAGDTSPQRWRVFGHEVQAHRAAFVGMLEALSAQGTVAAYGAPAKATTLLNFCGVTPPLLPYTVDRSELKTGRYVPGVHVPVLPVTELLVRRPDVTVILAWNFAGEIVAQQHAYRAAGGRFALPLPQPRLLT